MRTVLQYSSVDWFISVFHNVEFSYFWIFSDREIKYISLFLDGTISIISSDPSCKDVNVLFTIAPWRLHNMKDSVEFIFLLSVYYDNSNILQLKQAIHLCRETTIKNNRFSKLKSLIYNYILDQTMLLRVLLWIWNCWLAWGSHEITLIDPLSKNDFPCDLAPMKVPQHKLEIWPGYV